MAASTTAEIPARMLAHLASTPTVVEHDGAWVDTCGGHPAADSLCALCDGEGAVWCDCQDDSAIEECETCSGAGHLPCPQAHAAWCH